ncbi:UNVERIFIED_CONTAM: Splicing factor 3B subunit 5 [Gekko kuhli]
MTDRYTIHSQLEHLQSKYIGTGHADTTKWEWLVNQHRDSYCSYMGHFDLLNYFAIAENESKARVRFNLMEKMLQPCGPPADKPDESQGGEGCHLGASPTCCREVKACPGAPETWAATGGRFL